MKVAQSRSCPKSRVCIPRWKMRCAWVAGNPTPTSSAGKQFSCYLPYEHCTIVTNEKSGSGVFMTNSCICLIADRYCGTERADIEGRPVSRSIFSQPKNFFGWLKMLQAEYVGFCDG